MNKQDFLDKLRMALSGHVSPGVVTENINYYEEYINVEIRKGKSEAEVLQSLGDPRLIAKTIITTNGKDEGAEYRQDTYQNTGYEDGTGNGRFGRSRSINLPGWVGTLIIIAIVVVVLCLVFSVLSFLAPVILTVFVVMFLVKLFRDWLN